MATVDEYMAKADEALARADSQTLLSSYFLAVALAYRMLAYGEAKFCDVWRGRRSHDDA